MRAVTAGLIRLAVFAPSPYRSLVAALVREAVNKKLLDMMVRAQFIEGLMGYEPGVLSRDPAPHFDAARKALDRGEIDTNRILHVLIAEKGMSETDVKKMLQNADHGIWQAALSGAESAVPKHGIRGLSAEGIAQAIVGGFSPITHGPLKYGQGKGFFYWLGTRAPGSVSLNGLRSIAFKEVKNRAADVVRGTRDEETDAAQGDAPASLSEDGQAALLVDTLQQESAVPRATYVDLASAIYHDPWVMGIIDREVRSGLRGEVQEAVWTAIKQDPDLLIIKSDSIGVASEALAKVVSKAIGRPTTSQAVGQNFRQKVLPSIQLALEDSTMAKRLLKRRNILEIIEDATRRIIPPHESFPIPRSGVSVTPEGGSAGPGREWQEEYTERPEDPREKMPKWLKKLRSDPNLRALRNLGLRAARAARVASRHNDRRAWKMSPPQQKMYKQLKDWGRKNWEQFVDHHSGKINTDQMAAKMALIGGDTRMINDPTHWIWEIVYDVERQSRWR